MKVEIELAIKTCQCGMVYAVPYWLYPNYFTCPGCAAKTISTKEAQLNSQTNLIRALKGVITRMKRKHNGR